ncbi:hypothetical protein KKD70_05140 [Patescibacteria group bacterium]|nr:hypothetical protein [Patescibacteria group bacterium]
MAKSSVLHSKEKIKPKTFDEIEATNLTENEQDKISRSLILRWYKSRQFPKLKGLQNILMTASFSEREEIREKIKTNTQVELIKNSKEIPKTEVDKRAQAFADDIVQVGDGLVSIDFVVSKHDQQQAEEDIFFKTLDEYGHKANTNKMIDNLFANKNMQELLGFIQKQNPETYADIQKARKKGDYEEIRKLIAQGDPSGQLSEDKVDSIMTGIAMGGLGSKANLTSLKGIMTALDSLRAIGHTFALKKTAEKSKLSFAFVLRFAGKSFSEFQQIDNRLQKNAYLLDLKTTKTIADTDRLKFIQNVHALRTHLDSGLEAGGEKLQSDFKMLLAKHLETQKLDPRDKLYILENTKPEDLRMIQLYELLNAPDKDRNRWFLKSFSRIPTMLRFHKYVISESRDYAVMMQEYTVKRIVGKTRAMFSGNAKNWNMAGIAKEMDELEKMSKNWDPSLDNFNKKGSIASSELYNHDMILKKYQDLVRRSTEIMTKEAKITVGFAKKIENVQRMQKGKFYTETLSTLRPALGDDLIKNILGVTEITDDVLKKNGSDLLAAYGKKAVDLKSMQDITRTRFSVLAETVDANVAKPFSEKFQAKQEFVKGSAERRALSGQIDDVKDLVSPTGKIKYGLKKLALPGIILGAEGAALFSGKAKTREVAWDLGEAAAGFLPVAGTLLDFRAAVWGRSLSGRRLGWKERMLSAGFCAIGAVADTAMIVGGLGFGLRAGIGGMRTATRTLKVAKNMDNIRDAAAVAEVGGIAGKFKNMGAGIGKLFNKAHRADQAADAMVASKAYEQARLMSRFKIDDTGDIAKAIDKIKDSKIALNADDLKDLSKLQNLSQGIDGAKSYKAIFDAHSAAGALEIPKTFFGRGWLKTKETFLKLKQVFYKIGVAPEIIEQYEKSFDILKIAQAKKIEAIADLRKAETLRVVELAKKEEAFEMATKQLKTIDKKYADVLIENRKLQKNLVESENAEKIARLKLQKLEKTKGAAPEQIEGAKNAWVDSRVNFEKQQFYAKKGDQNIETLKNSKNYNAEEFKKIEVMDQEILGIEKGVMNAEHSVRMAETEIYLANKTRSMTEMDMIQKSERALQYSNSMRIAASYMQKAGLAMGLTMFLTGGTFGPEKQLKTAYKVAATGVNTVGFVGNEYLHSDYSRMPLDLMIEDRIGSLARKQKFNSELQKAQSQGENVYKVYALNWHEADVQEQAQRNGVDINKVNAWLAKMPGFSPIKETVGAMKQNATGVVKEKLGSGRKVA